MTSHVFGEGDILKDSCGLRDAARVPGGPARARTGDSRSPKKKPQRGPTSQSALLMTKPAVQPAAELQTCALPCALPGKREGEHSEPRGELRVDVPQERALEQRQLRRAPLAYKRESCVGGGGGGAVRRSWTSEFRGW